MPMLRCFNNITPTISFTIQKENNNSINLLDITIYKTENVLPFRVYRKPTATDHIIPHSSNHHPEHNRSALNYLSHRLISYPLQDTDKQREYETIKNILHNNSRHIHKTTTTRLQTQQITHTPSQTQHEGEITNRREKQSGPPSPT